jgi:hypothetical protein
VGELLSSQLGSGARRWVATECLHTAFTGTSQPLTDRAFGDAQSRGDVLLFPSLLFQVPGPSSSTFEPAKLCCVLVHTPSLAGLGPHAEVSSSDDSP